MLKLIAQCNGVIEKYIIHAYFVPPILYDLLSPCYSLGRPGRGFNCGTKELHLQTVKHPNSGNNPVYWRNGSRRRRRVIEKKMKPEWSSDGHSLCDLRGVKTDIAVRLLSAIISRQHNQPTYYYYRVYTRLFVQKGIFRDVFCFGQ